MQYIVILNAEYSATTVVAIALLFLQGYEDVPIRLYDSISERDRGACIFVNCTPLVKVDGDLCFKSSADSSILKLFKLMHFNPMYKRELYLFAQAVERYQLNVNGAHDKWNAMPMGTINFNSLVRMCHKDMDGLAVAVSLALDIFTLLQWKTYNERAKHGR